MTSAMTRKNSVARVRRSPVRKFNPGTLQSDQEVVDQFVVRTANSIPCSKFCMGTSNRLLASMSWSLLLAAEENDAARSRRGGTAYKRQVLPIPVARSLHGRESRNIRCGGLLAGDAVPSGKRECSKVIRNLRRSCEKRMRIYPDAGARRALGDRARAVVLNAAERIDRKLVLMVENLQTLCESVDDDFGWQLRAALQSESKIMMLASATSRFEGLEDAEEPFFELFRVIDLTPLTTEECRRLWRRSAETRSVLGM